MPKSLLTPKDLADAVGVSESSMRRWIDTGAVQMTRTAGGHRRILLADALRFIRETGTPLVRGEILGVGEITQIAEQRVFDEDKLFDALAAGDRTLARGLINAWHFAGRSLASIFDGPMRSALTRLGELWLRERPGILVEHRATDICIEIIHHARGQLAAPSADACVAIGATPKEEWHALPSQMAAAVARESGLRDINYGPDAPIELLAREAERQKARLVWLSITVAPARGTQAQVRRLAEELADRDADLVIGGRHANAVAHHSKARVFGSMSEFAAFVQGSCNSKRS